MVSNIDRTAVTFASPSGRGCAGLGVGESEALTGTDGSLEPDALVFPTDRVHQEHQQDDREQQGEG